VIDTSPICAAVDRRNVDQIDAVFLTRECDHPRDRTTFAQLCCIREAHPALSQSSTADTSCCAFHIVCRAAGSDYTADPGQSSKSRPVQAAQAKGRGSGDTFSVHPANTAIPGIGLSRSVDAAYTPDVSESAAAGRSGRTRTLRIHRRAALTGAPQHVSVNDALVLDRPLKTHAGPSSLPCPYDLDYRSGGTACRPNVIPPMTDAR